jgi:hypothetical protein
MGQVFITVDSEDEARDFEVDVSDVAAFIEQLELALLELKLKIEEE